MGINSDITAYEIVLQLEDSYTFDFGCASNDELIAEVAGRLERLYGWRPETAVGAATAGVAQYNREWEKNCKEQEQIMDDILAGRYNPFADDEDSNA